jgi:hypothetical protein
MCGLRLRSALGENVGLLAIRLLKLKLGSSRSRLTMKVRWRAARWPCHCEFVNCLSPSPSSIPSLAQPQHAAQAPPQAPLTPTPR